MIISLNYANNGKNGSSQIDFIKDIIIDCTDRLAVITRVIADFFEHKKRKEL